MAEKPNFVLIGDDAPPQALPAARRSESADPSSAPPASGLAQHVSAGGMLVRLQAIATAAITAAASSLLSVLGHARPPAEAAVPSRPRLVFAVDATASREPAWAAARRVTDTLVKALPGALDVALAVHGGSRVHTFTAFTSDPTTLRDRAAGVACEAGLTRLLPILSTSLKQPQVRVVIYIGDVFEESVLQGRRLADAMGKQGIRLIVLHDTADPAASRYAEIFWDLARRTGGCVLPFDAGASSRLRDILSAVAVYAVGGEKLLRERRHDLPGAVALLEHLGRQK